jgi:hypothetical protein
MIDENGIKSHVCKISIFGKTHDIKDDRYLLGNQFLKGYYVALNYTGDGYIGFNGEYAPIEIHIPPKPVVPTPPAISPWVVIMVIGGILLFVSVGICVCIKKKNEQLQEELDQQTKNN